LKAASCEEFKSHLRFRRQKFYLLKKIRASGIVEFKKNRNAMAENCERDPHRVLNKRKCLCTLLVTACTARCNGTLFLFSSSTKATNGCKVRKAAAIVLFFVSVLRADGQDAQIGEVIPPQRHDFFIGIEAGWVTNYLITNISNLSFTRYEPRGGYTVAIPLQYSINSWFELYSNPGVIQKNYTYSRSGFFEGIRELHTNTYLQVPLVARFSFGGRRLKGFLDLGVYGAYWAWGRVSGSEPNILDPGTQTYNSANPAGIYDIINRYDFDERYDFNTVRDNRFEFGGTLGVGMRYEFASGFMAFIEGKKIQPVTDQQKKYMSNQVPRYNSTYAFTFGVMVNVSNIGL
jgi:hypothetical protein